MKIKFLVASLLFSTTASAETLDTAQAVLDCAAQNAPENSFLQAARLEVKRKDSVLRVIIADFAAQRGERGFEMNIGVQQPPDVSGTAVLVRQINAERDDLKLYLPALRRVRTITGASAGQDLLGTDFSYADIKQVYGAFSRAEAEMQELAEWKGRPVYSLRMHPPVVEDEERPYELLTALIDQQDCVPLVIEFQGEAGEVLKRLEGDWESMMEVGERRMLAKYVMFNLDKGTETHLHLGPPQFDEKIGRLAFHPGSFYNWHNDADKPE